MNDRDTRMECLRLAVSVRHLIPMDVKTVEIAQAYYDFATGPHYTLSLNGSARAGSSLQAANTAQQ